MLVVLKVLVVFPGTMETIVPSFLHSVFELIQVVGLDQVVVFSQVAQYEIVLISYHPYLNETNDFFYVSVLYVCPSFILCALILLSFQKVLRHP